MPFIQLTDIRKTYHMGDLDVPVLHGVSLSLDKGQFVALMGASGSGKSTLMHIMGCLDRPSSGSYRLDGREVTRLSSDGRARERQRTIGFVFQSFNLLPRTSAIDNVAMPLAYAADAPSEHRARQRAIEALERVGLADRMHHYPSQLSGGQQQRVAIARALINSPALLLADEPTGNLDQRTSEDVLALFGQLNARDGITVLLVTHEADVARHARRIVHIRDGLIVESSAARAAEAALVHPGNTGGAP